MSKHTPTPWEFQDISNSHHDDGLGYINGPDGIEIDHHGSNRRSKEENLANAAFIVEACNSHDALVAENKRLRKALNNAIEHCQEMLGEPAFRSVHPIGKCPTLDSLRAALAEPDKGEG